MRELSRVAAQTKRALTGFGLIEIQFYMSDRGPTLYRRTPRYAGPPHLRGSSLTHAQGRNFIIIITIRAKAPD